MDSILIADDNPENLKVLSTILKQEGYDVRVATNGKQALESIEAKRPGLVMLDIQMPKMDGYEVCRHMKADETLAHIPVLFISAMDDPFNKVLAFQSGASDYITKPIQTEEVLARVKTHLDINTCQQMLEDKNIELLQQFQHTFEQAAIGMAHIDPETQKFIKVNQRCADILGISKDHLMDKTFWEFIPPEYRVQDKRELLNWMETRSNSFSTERQYIRADGSKIWCRVATSLVRFGKRQIPDYLAVIFEDISETKQAEALLTKSEKNYREIFNAGTDAILIHDAETGQILDVNQPMLEMFGYTYEEALQLEVGDISSGKPTYTQQDAMVKIQRAVANGPQLLEWEACRKNGEEFWIEVALKKTRIGGKGRVLAVVREITERKKADLEKIESEKMLKAIFNHRFQLTGLLDGDGKLVMANKNVCDMAGVGHDEIVGEYVWRLPHWAHSEEEQRAIEAAVQTVKTGRSIKFETTHTSASGDIRHFDFSITPFFDENGNVVYMIPEGKDITERRNFETEQKRLEKQLQQAQKMEAIGTLAGGIAHDFNNILSAIIGYSEISKLELPRTSPLSKNLDNILQAGYRAKDLVQQILTFSRQKEHEFKPVAVKTLTKEALKLLRASLPTTIEIRQELFSESLVMGDTSQIHQIIMNLCTNAGHAMRKRGGILALKLIDVDLRPEHILHNPESTPGPYIELSVEDTGEGMPQVVKERIFDPFFTTKKRGEGTGMGLAVVHGIVRSCGGIINAESTPGKGSIFRVFLPRMITAPSTEKVEKEQLPTGTEHILLIDDEPAIVEIGKYELEHLGYHVTVSTSSTGALDLFKTDPNRFDLVITDLTMPVMTGDRLAQKLQAVRDDILIILCTGFSSQITEADASKIGIKAVLMKPIIRKELATMVRQVLDGSEG